MDNPIISENLPVELQKVIVFYLSDTWKFCLKLTCRYWLNILSDVKINNNIKLDLLSVEATKCHNKIKVIENKIDSILTVPDNPQLKETIGEIFDFYSHVFDEKYEKRIVSGIENFEYDIKYYNAPRNYKFKYDCTKDLFNQKCAFCEAGQKDKPHSLEMNKYYKKVSNRKEHPVWIINNPKNKYNKKMLRGHFLLSKNTVMMHGQYPVHILQLLIAKHNFENKY